MLVYFRRFDHCSFRTDTRLDTMRLPPRAFKVRGDLGTATLNATVAFRDTVAGETLPLELDLSWRATGDLQREQHRFRTKADDSVWVSRTVLEIRDAASVGRIGDGTRDWAAGSAAIGAGIASTRLGLVTIDRS